MACACACIMPTCRTCYGDGTSAAGSKPEAAPPCVCFLQSCRECFPEVLGGSEGKGPGPAGINAAGPQCQCFMPGCDACMRDAASVAAADPIYRKRKRRQHPELPLGRCSRSNVSALVAMACACACSMPTCRTCCGDGTSAAGSKPEAAPPCVCFLQSCRECFPEVLGGSEGKGPGPAGINAAGPQCQCFMPGCDACMRDAAAVAAADPISRKRKCRQRRELPPGHSKCSLRDELEIDARMHQGSCGHHAAHAKRRATLARIFLLMAQPTLSALEMVGRPRGERWDFFEIYAGCANFTAAVAALGMTVGPAVDILHKLGGLRLDCLLENSQALMQAVLAEARPRWVHVGPPCTFWCRMSRWCKHVFFLVFLFWVVQGVKGFPAD